MSILTEELEIAYASSPAGQVLIYTIEINNAAFAEPARLACGVVDDIDLPLELGGQPVTFTAASFEIIAPGASEDGATKGKIRVGDLSGKLYPYEKLATEASTPTTLTYRSYVSTDLSRPGDVIANLEINNIVRASNNDVEAEIGFPEVELQAFPGVVYDDGYYPAIQQS